MVSKLRSLNMAHLPQMLGSEGLQVQKNAHKGRNIAVFTSGGDSQGRSIHIFINKNELVIYGNATSCVMYSEFSMLNR